MSDPRFYIIDEASEITPEMWDKFKPLVCRDSTPLPEPLLGFGLEKKI